MEPAAKPAIPGCFKLCFEDGLLDTPLLTRGHRYRHETESIQDLSHPLWLCGMDTRVCDDCEPEGGDAASVTSEVGCRRRSRLTGAAQHSHKRRSVTFDLPPQVERACCAAASDPSPDRDVEDEEMVPPWELPGGLVCARESIFVIPGVDCLGCLLGACWATGRSSPWSTPSAATPPTSQRRPGRRQALRRMRAPSAARRACWRPSGRRRASAS